MTGPIISPDGKWMWTGTEWIPTPPVSANTPTQPAGSSDTIQNVAKVQNKQINSCGECNSSNTRIITCSSVYCDKTFCEICHKYCKFEIVRYLNTSKISALKLRHIQPPPGSYPWEWEPEYFDDDLTNMVQDKVEHYLTNGEMYVFSTIDLSQQSSLKMYDLDNQFGSRSHTFGTQSLQGPFCKSCLDARDNEEKKASLDYLNKLLSGLCHEADTKIKEYNREEAEQQQEITSMKIDNLREQQIQFKRFWTSVTIGLVIIALMPLIAPTLYDSMEDDDPDSSDTLLDEPENLPVLLLMETACCFYPAYLLFAKEVNPFENPKVTVTELSELEKKTHETPGKTLHRWKLNVIFYPSKHHFRVIV